MSKYSSPDFKYIKFFDEIKISDLPSVGGKNASLGEMYYQLHSYGVNIPYGFAITAEAYYDFLRYNGIYDQLSDLMKEVNQDINQLRWVGEKARTIIMNASFSKDLVREIEEAYHLLSDKTMANVDVAVRSSATAEDLPTASFAGQHDSFLYISGTEKLLLTCKKCYASLFNDRAIKYRINNGFEHMHVAISVGVQQMVRSDKACSGVIFTIEPETGFANMIYATGCWGLGENIVQGTVNPDEYFFFKPSLSKNKKSLITKKLGSKALKMVYDDATGSLKNIPATEEEMKKYVLTNDEAEMLAQWCLKIEEHYKMPMDIEWAKDGISNKIYIVQARPETIHGKEGKVTIREFKLLSKGQVLSEGKAVGSQIVTGIARILKSPADAHKLRDGEILITDITNPDWNTVLKKSSAIVTNKGGRTSHAAIVARELGVVAIVGCNDATQKITDGQEITVCCAEGDVGRVYDGILKYEVRDITLQNEVTTKTKPMFILADPDKALKLSQYPNEGVGLLRLEFAINNSIKVHPMALVKYDELRDEQAKKEIAEWTLHYEQKSEYFIDKLSQAVAMVAAAFYPKDVIVRMSDFKTNEYANLIGGKEFEPEEENPMLGFRGASRYYSSYYREGFKLECEAMKRVRNELGFDNVKLMIPFCRTVEEGKKVIGLMKDFGLVQGENGLEIYVMIEIPANVILADDFAKIFDGFSIGSNDLTQLTLGIDRDNSIISELFSEQNPAVTRLISDVIKTAKKNNIKIGLCGQAPSDYPHFAQFLVEAGIDSISFNPDALLRGIENIQAAEKLITETAK